MRRKPNKKNLFEDCFDLKNPLEAVQKVSIEPVKDEGPVTLKMKIVLDFSGGAEVLFDNIKKRDLELESDKKWTIRDFLVYMKDNLLRERLDLFMQGDSVRPGILVLVNDTDWELLGELDYELQQNDNISFISTLHGG